MSKKHVFFKRFGWRLVVGYLFLFVVFAALVLLYAGGHMNMWWLLITTFAGCVLLSWIMYVRLIIPLEEIASSAEEMARGNLDQEIRVLTQDEIGNLACSINYIARQLRNTIEDVMLERNRTQAVLSGMSEGVIALDIWGRVVFINQVAEELFRITMAASRGKNILRVIRNYDLEKILNHALETGCSTKKHVQIFTPEPRVFQVHVTPLRNAGNDRGGVVALLKDITERKMLEEMRSEFVANVSHELRTPLTSIKGFAETLIDGALEDPQVTRHFLEIINTETDRLSRLIDELLNLSRIESGKALPNLQSLKIRELVDKAVAILQPRAKKKNIAIELDIPDNLPMVQADSDMINQVLINLIENAVSYTQPGGLVNIRASVYEDQIRVEVQDNGIGIPPENLSRIFERFYRVDKARSRELGGTGLGLSIVKHIIEAHHGRVEVESKAGAGSTFSFNLPLYEPNLPACQP
ncbi:MAG TPA: ATP-binding protein [Bacillota bacterium]|nr:ATP-binding protein [Bacillota bacterium]